MSNIKAPVGSIYYGTGLNSIKFMAPGHTAQAPQTVEFTRKTPNATGYASYSMKFVYGHAKSATDATIVYSWAEIRFVSAPGITATVANTIYQDLKEAATIGTVANGLASDAFITQVLPSQTDINV